MYRTSAAIVMAALALAGVGCERAKSANPLSPSIAGPIPGVDITAPRLLEPAAGSNVVQDGQPVTLLIENASTTGERPLWVQVELAADQGFQQLLHHADRVSPGDGGRTSYRMPELLGSGYTYYWRARAQDGANTGPYSAVGSFRVVEPVVVDPPIPLEPIGGISTVTPTFRLRNGRIEGTTGVIYRIEVATAPDPGSVVAVMNVAADPSGTTSIAVTQQVPYATTYYWRAYGTDGSVTSTYSNVVSFTTPAAPPGGGGSPSPAPPPSPGGGARTPNPPAGQRLPLPGYGAGTVSDVAARYLSAMRNSCQEHGGTWEFMDRPLDRLRTMDTRWGYNGKRGNTNDPSHDVVDYNSAAAPTKARPTSTSST
ncbi:MAG: hypothetical protein R2712_29340 [Vicinamibacterales bacterium]